MQSRNKKLSIVVYCNGNFDETKKTLYSILDQKLSHLFYDVFILNDNANKNNTDKINKFIKKEDLVNFNVYSFSYYTGMPLTFNFLIKNNIIKSKYTTIIKSGDIFEDNFVGYFLENLYSLDNDLYMYDLRDELIVTKEKIDENDGKNYSISKSKIIIASIPSGPISQDEAFTTKPIFLGKIWKTQNILGLKLDNDRILYQDIFMYIQMISFTNKIWYESKYAGTIRRKSWLPEKMDKKRIELLSLTLNKMISRNPYINGQVLQLLSLALQRTSEAEKRLYLLSNHKYLQNNNVVPIYGISKRKVLKLTKPFIESGEIKQANN